MKDRRTIVWLALAVLVMLATLWLSRAAPTDYQQRRGNAETRTCLHEGLPYSEGAYREKGRVRCVAGRWEDQPQVGGLR